MFATSLSYCLFFFRNWRQKTSKRYPKHMKYCRMTKKENCMMTDQKCSAVKGNIKNQVEMKMQPTVKRNMKRFSHIQISDSGTIIHKQMN